MGKNFDRYFDGEGNIKEGVLEGNRWLKFLTETDNVYVNAERLESMGSLSGKETLMYVMKTLDILDEIAERDGLPAEEKELVATTLKWSEVAKGGISKERNAWREKGYPLDIHNIASAYIYRDETGDDGFIYTLIKTHGVIGQCIRGEISVSGNKELLAYRDDKEHDLQRLLFALNECIIRAVSEKIWESNKVSVRSLIADIASGQLKEFSPQYRLQRLCPGEMEFFASDVDFFDKEIFPKYELWYFEAALSSFDMGQIKTVLVNTLKEITKSGEEVEHLNFKPLSDNLYYDYEGKKHVNVYKKRIIEKYLLDASVQNVDISVTIENKSAFVDFKFSKVCEKLIEFCVEAERSGLLTFEKSIIVLYDMFGFRRDAFDRLNNEDKYLSTMNNVAKSTKDSVVDYVTGNSVVDVGSGGGILLDKLESRFPDKEIIGTDISTNVIEALNQKKHREGHGWNVLVHNFVDGTMGREVGSIIFSSILHEIYSYTEGENGRFDIASVKKALRNAYDSLGNGGRIIIRDGIKTEGNAVRKIRFKTAAGLDFFKNYVKDFKGLKDIPEEKKVLFTDDKSLTVSGDINFIREFLYTYTWGNESYAHEVQEQFGYFTLREYREFFEEMGASVIVAKEFLEPGYPDNLGKYLDLLDEKDEETEYPASNCIIVVEKSE
ncbi:methyltransferase [Butyrivibrio sp. XB500-5]|uniref:methyltransferase domain-containing protein n=1 Tax=Butyrivibrio sp. XB500-5 TaxID=2364880 RepID=UPI000EA8F7AE|nr:methyltransferase domain-containing protein [Butyrivibrio sp. XB500-5]RKM58611.1 methyltransferase [Butyrivibrio sp. XB500-5]